MASKEKELEERLREVGGRLASPPSTVDELLALLDQIERLLLIVEQSPSQPISNAIRPAVTALVARGFLEHSDLDVKVGVASCISEITRITAPEAPYDDTLMKEIFERFVETFERLDDLSSRSFSKRVAILETLAKVRSCVVMLDLECDALILKMFQYFFKTIRPDNARMVFSPMATIMALVLEESEDISPELILCLLEIVKIDNKDILPVARELGEKVISSCASKIKPYLSELCKSMNLSGYSSIVASICHEAPDVFEQNELAASADNMADDSKLSEQTVSDELHKGSGKVEQEVDCSEVAIQEKIPEQGISNDGSMVNNNSTVDPSSLKQKSECPDDGDMPRKTAAVGKRDSSDLEPNDMSIPVAKKVKSRPVSSSGSLKRERENHSLAEGTPANDVEACKKNLVVADNGISDTFQRKRGRPNSKLSSMEGGDSGASKHKSSRLQKGSGTSNKAISSKNGSKKESDCTIHSEQKPLLCDDEKEPNSAAKPEEPLDATSPSENKSSKQSSKRISSRLQKGSGTSNKAISPKNGSKKESDCTIHSEQKPLLCDDEKEPNSAAKPEEPLDATSPSENKSSKQSSKRMSASKASLGMSSQKQKSCGKQHDKPNPEKDRRSGGPSLKEMMSSGKKAPKTKGDAEGKVKSSSKHAGGAEEESPETPDQYRELAESFVGSRIKVWWPNDKEYYQATVGTYYPYTKKHKILYDDGDIEVLVLEREHWVLLEEDHKKREAKDNSIPHASSEEPQGKRTKTSSSSVSKEYNRGTESDLPKRKGRPPKGTSLAEDRSNDSSKVIGKSDTKKKDGTKSSLAEDIPVDSSKTIGKSTTKDAGTQTSPSDAPKSIGKSAVKDVGTKSSLAVGSPGRTSKALGKSGTKKDATTKSKTGSKFDDDAENTPKNSSKTKDDAGSKEKMVLRGKLSKDSSAADRKLKISGPIGKGK